jgi:hypothetical protein
MAEAELTALPAPLSTPQARIVGSDGQKRMSATPVIWATKLGTIE